MKLKTLFLLLLTYVGISSQSQTPYTTAIDFNVKTLEGEIIELFPLLENDKIVVIDFFSTSCGPCQTFAYDFQLAYEGFGSNQGNVFFLGINYNGTNEDVRFFDSLYNISLPSASGLDGGGNKVFDTYLVAAYPTVIVIKPDHTISAQYVWEPTVENITEAVLLAGGLYVGLESKMYPDEITLYPNPATNFVSIKSENLIHTENISIKNITGQHIADIKLLNENNKNSDYEVHLPLPALPNGIYFIEIHTNTKILSQKLIIQN